MLPIILVKVWNLWFFLIHKLEPAPTLMECAYLLSLLGTTSCVTPLAVHCIYCLEYERENICNKCYHIFFIWQAQARRTVFFVMLSGLAWTDLVGLLAVSPIAIITYANNLSWVGGVPLCRYHGFMMVSFGVVMPLIVCCMSVERFLAIKFAYYYARHITRRKAQLIFLACWAVTASFTTLPFVGFGSYELQYPGSWCFLNFHRESKVDTIYAAMFSSLNIVAILIMILCNLVVAGTLFRLRLRRRLHSSPSIDRRLSVSGIGSSTSGTVIRQKHHSDMEAQMIWFLCLITVAFSVCWLPLNVSLLSTLSNSLIVSINEKNVENVEDIKTNKSSSV